MRHHCESQIANGFLPVVKGQLLLIIDDDAPNWTVVRETGPAVRATDGAASPVTRTGSFPRQGYVPANYIARIEPNPGAAATAKRTTSGTSDTAANDRSQDRARVHSGNSPRKCVIAALHDSILVGAGRLVSPDGSCVRCRMCRRNSRGRSASPMVRHQHNQERPGSLMAKVNTLQQSAVAIDPSTYSQSELESQPQPQLPKHPEMPSSTPGFARSAVQEKARSSSAFSESLLRVGLEGVDGTTVDHLGSGLQLGWRDDGDSHVNLGQLTSPTGTSLPPAVRINAAEEAELLGTETDVEDDVANLLTLTKTDL